MEVDEAEAAGILVDRFGVFVGCFRASHWVWARDVVMDDDIRGFRFFPTHDGCRVFAATNLGDLLGRGVGAG